MFTTGGAQSNHAMLTAACAARLGMQCTLLLKKRGVTDHRGNLVLDEIFGAQVRLWTPTLRGHLRGDASGREELAAEGHKGSIIPVGGSTALGAVGYVSCVREMRRAGQGGRHRLGHLVSATGSGGTTAGLLLGASLFLPGGQGHRHRRGHAPL